MENNENRSVAPTDNVENSENTVATSVENKTIDGTSEQQESVELPERVNYRQLYEETEDRLKKAEFALYKRNKAEKEKRNIQEPVDTQDIEHLVETKAIEILEAQRRKDSEDLLEEELMRSSGNSDERDLIKLIYDNRIVKTGYSRMSIRDDLENAKILANKPLILKEKKELVESLNAKRSVSSTSIGSNQSKPVGQKDDLSKNFSVRDWQFIKERGWDEKTIRKAIENKGKGIA